MKPHLNNQLKAFIEDVEKNLSRKITFNSSKKLPDSNLLARSHADIDNAKVYLDPSTDYSKIIGQFKIAHEIVHIHFHKNLNFSDLDYIYPNDSIKRLFGHLASSIEDLFVFDYLKKIGIPGYEENYNQEVIPLINIYKIAVPKLNRVEGAYQEIVKKTGYIYLSLISKRGHRKKLRNAYIKSFGAETTKKLDNLINELRQIYNSSLDNNDKCKNMTRLLLKKLGALSLLNN